MVGISSDYSRIRAPISDNRQALSAPTVCNTLHGHIPIWLNEGLAEFCADFLFHVGPPPRIYFGLPSFVRTSGCNKLLSYKSSDGMHLKNLTPLLRWNDYSSNSLEKFNRSLSFLRYVSDTYPNTVFHDLLRWSVSCRPISSFWFKLALMWHGRLDGAAETTPEPLWNWSLALEQEWTSYANTNHLDPNVLHRRSQHNSSLKIL